MDFTLTSASPQRSRYLPTAPNSRAILFVMPGGYGFMHDHIGEALDLELESRTEREVADDLISLAPGTGFFVWEGTVSYVRCGPYDCPDVEAEFVGTFRPLTEQEARHLQRDEYAWDVEEWFTPETIEAEARARLLNDAVTKANFELVERCRRLLTPPVSEDAVVFRWYLDQLGQIEEGVQALVKAESDAEGW